MKISKIQIEALAIPLLHPYRLSVEYGVFREATPVLVRMFTDEGLSGCGECDPWPLFTGDSSQTVLTVLAEHLAPMLIGQDPTNLNALHQKMDAVIRGQQLSKSAVDMAAYDLWGKACGIPVHQLLGGKRRQAMRCMWSIGGSTPEESAQEVLAARQAGYDGCMIKIGGPDYRLDAARTRAVREAVGRDFPLIVDANQGWDLDTAIRYARLIRDLDILFFEQPLQSWDISGMAKLRRSIEIPVSADESVMTLADARALVQAEAADVFSVKITKNGGLHPARAICEYAAASGVPVFFNSMIEAGVTQAASLHLGLTCRNPFPGVGHAYFSPNRLQRDICSFSSQIHPAQGLTEGSDAPGLGVALDEAAIRRYRRHSVTISSPR